MIKRHPVISFVVLSFLITWPLHTLGFVLANGAGISLSLEDNFHHLSDLLTLNTSWDRLAPFLVYTIGQFGPVLAAFVITAVIYGRVGVRDLGARMLKWRVQPRWYLTILLIPLIFTVVSLAAGFLVDGFKLGPFSPGVAWVYFVPFLLFMIVFTGVAEEPGWRGFALPHLQAKNTAVRSSWVLGIIWGMWHLPFTLYFNREQPLLIIPALLALTLGIVGWTIVLTWVYNNTQSVWLIILLHGWDNTVRSYLVLSQPNFLAMSLNTLLAWALAVFLAKRYGDENLGVLPRPRWWPGMHEVEERVPSPATPDAGSRDVQRTAEPARP